MHTTPPILPNVQSPLEGNAPVVLVQGLSEKAVSEKTVLEKTGTLSVEERSRWLGRSIARKLSESTPLEWLLGEDSRKASRARSLDPTLLLGLKRLGDPQSLDQEGIGQILCWAAEQTANWESSIRETSLLKPLMPIYLASAMAPEEQHEAQRIARSNSKQLFLEMIGALELHQALSHVGFLEWMKHRVQPTEDLGRWIHRGLRVDLHPLTSAMIERWARNQSKTVSQPISAQPILDRDHHRWWSLAWQWSQAKTAMLVPAGLPVIVEPWDELISHWKQLYGSLIQQEQTTTPKLIEIRCSNDGQLGNFLDRWLEDLRAEQGILTLVSVRFVGDMASHPKPQDAISWWQTAWLQCMGAALDATHPRGFVTESGDIGILYRDLDRTELSQRVREAFDKMHKVLVATKCLAENRPAPLNAGIASVHAPAKSFCMQHLMDAAWRCLGNAALQGHAAVKSIEVY